MNVSEKSNMGTLGSPVQFRSSESLTSSRPYRNLNAPVQVGYPLGYWDAPQPLAFEGKGRVALMGSSGNLRMPPVIERTPRRRPNEPEPIRQQQQPTQPRRRKHRGNGNDGNGNHRNSGRHHRRSRRSRSDNALHLAADRANHMMEPPHRRVQEDYDRFPAGRTARDLFGVGGMGGYRQQPYRPCPRTTSDLTLHNAAGGGGIQPLGLGGQYCGGEGYGEGADPWCSSCSESSESEEDEGYFLGEPIPRPIQLRYLNNEELRHRYSPTGVGGMGGHHGPIHGPLHGPLHGGNQGQLHGQLHMRQRRKSKNCIIS